MIGSFVCNGVGGGSTISLLVTEGFGVGSVAPAPAATVGWVFKKHRGRYFTEINGQRIEARSVPALEAMVAAYRKAHPANDTKPTIPQPQPQKEVVRDRTGPEFHPTIPAHHTAPPPATVRAPGAVVPQFGPSQYELAAVSAALAAQQAAQSLAEAAERAREATRQQAIDADEADVEALLAILMEAA